MIVDLVHVMTHDGLHLDGPWRKRHAEYPPQLGVDGVIFYHGIAGNFDTPSMFEGCNDAGLRF
jgi:hypothetical protein